MGRPAKNRIAEIDLPENLIFEDDYGNKITEASESFSSEVIHNDDNEIIGYRIEGDVSGHGTIALKVYPSGYEVVTDDSVDTDSLIFTDETFQEINITLPDA